MKNKDDDYQIENSISTRRETKDSSSRLIVNLAVPENEKIFSLRIFARNANENESTFLTTFYLRRNKKNENDDMKLFNFGLICLNQKSSEIRTKQNPLIIEYHSYQRIAFLINLKDENENEIKYAGFVQCDYSSSPFKYCLITLLPKKLTKYSLMLYGKTTNDSSDSYSFVTKYSVIRKNDEINYNLPKYNIEYTYGIKLKSHYSNLVYADENPLEMEFKVPKTTLVSFYLKRINADSNLENSLIIYRNQNNTEKLIVKVAIPDQKETFILNLFAKNLNEDDNKANEFVTQFLIIKKSHLNNELKFLSFNYNELQLNVYVYHPCEFYLKANKFYEFKYFIKKAIKVAFVDSSKSWFYLDKSDSEMDIWVLEEAFSTRGLLNLFANFDESKNFEWICRYELV